MFRQAGMTFVELLISVLITSVMMMLLVNYYLSSKRQYLEAQTQLNASYDLQLITELLQHSIRHAGFAPCLSVNWLKIYDARNPAHQPIVIASQYGKRHALHIERMSEEFATMAASPRGSHFSLKGNFTAKQTILIADCFHGEIVAINAVRNHGQQLEITIPKPLHFHYVPPVYVGAWLEEDFFVQKNTRGQLALYYAVNHAEELTNMVNSLEAQLVKNNNKLLLVLTLGLLKQESLEIKTALRMT